jgi:hypothetical protein
MYGVIDEIVAAPPSRQTLAKFTSVDWPGLTISNGPRHDICTTHAMGTLAGIAKHDPDTSATTRRGLVSSYPPVPPMKTCGTVVNPVGRGFQLTTERRVDIDTHGFDLEFSEVPWPPVEPTG